MGRHADPSDRRRRFDASALFESRLLPIVVVVLALVVGGVVWAANRHDGCSSQQSVRVAVAPELKDVAGRLLADPQPAGDGACAVATVSARQPLQTVADMGALPASSLPQVWVPDSSLWTARVSKVPLSSVGSVATSPVVLATSKAVADAQGWGATPPTWAGALTSNRPIAVPDLAGSATGLSALAALRASLGGTQQADTAVVQAVLAAERGPALSVQDALDAGRSGKSDAPLVPVSEREVIAANQGSAGSALVAVYPSDGSPRLDYPVLRVGQPSGAQRAAVEAITRRLTSAAASAAARAVGLRGLAGQAPTGKTTGITAAAPQVLALDPGQVAQLFARLASLAKPSRILAAFDVSTSMNEPVGNATRVTLARDAAKSALTLIPDSSAIGLWDFAYHLSGNDDFSALVPTRPLGADAGGKTQRQVLGEQLDALPSRLSPGGTGLYDTTLAAVRSARSSYDPAAVNSVLLVTDGANDDDAGSMTLDQLVQYLKGEADPSRPVKVIAVGLGKDADMDALRTISDATGGAAYSAVDPRDLQSVLFDAIRQRS